ncbi:sensor histidine kinase [Algivirga pacifica]|uniref:Histidine kinase n=1 Tax=Algivirga pacifica TaxID=1162670 RepID=A0ABP9CW35_9BACT
MEELIALRQKRWFKILSVVLIGCLIQFLIDLVFRLIYRNYSVFGFDQLLNYGVAILYVYVLTVVLGYIRNWSAEVFPWREGALKRVLIQVGLSLLIVLMVNLVMRYLLGPSQGLILLSRELVVNMIVMAVFLVVVLIDLGIVLFEQYITSLNEVEKFQKENVEFKLKMLKSQINPHFLFNSLNVLSSLIYTDAEKASVYVRELSKLYRFILDSRQTELVSLRVELKTLASYIYLVSLRFDQNLTINLAIQESYQETLIAPMTLQMLIENAIKHNVVSRKRPLSIDIQVEQDQYIVVSNNLQLKSTPEGTSTRVGLRNIRNRYLFLTGEPVQIEAAEGMFKVRIPLIRK